MPLNITNQKPVVLSPAYIPKITGDFDPMTLVQNTLVAPLRQPLVPGTPVTFADGANALGDDIIAQRIVDCCGEVTDVTAEAWARMLFQRTLQFFDQQAPLGIQNLFVIQAAVQEKLPFPIPGQVVYTPAQDVIPASKEFIGGFCSYEKYFASLALYARPETLGFYFVNETAFNDFKAWLQNETNNIAAQLPAQVNQLFADFQTDIKLDGLTESLTLRKDDSDGNDEYSFPRVLTAMLMRYTQAISPAMYGVLPFNMGELFCPRSMVFVNVEKHAYASSRQVKEEWELINQSIQQQINMVSNTKLSKLTSTLRNIKKIQGQAANALTNLGQSVGRSQTIVFKSNSPTVVDITKLLRRIMSKMATVNRSQNSYKSVKASFAKPNRRDPDDFNKQGKTVSVRYYPDIHLYIDTSGSISEENYQDTVKACMAIAKKLNINIYFNSFSHVLSQCTLLKTANKTGRQLYAEFQRVPKVDGGTDYEQIWHYINRSKKRRREISLIITDFEWTPRNHYVEHPANLYYVPCSRMDWQYMTHCATSFAQAMLRNDPNIRKHILM